MLRIAICILLCATTAFADDYDLTQDECAEPGAGCQPEMTDAELDAAEVASEEAEPIEWIASTTDVQCAEGSTNVDGQCAPESLDVAGGCSVGGAAGLLVIFAIVLLAKRRRLLPIVIVACAVDETSWDDAVDAGKRGEDTRDVLVAELGDHDGVQYLLDKQALRDGALEPTAQFALSVTRGDVPIVRVHSTCGDRLATIDEPGAELLGWARGESGDGTAALVELQAPDGCFVYETDREAIDTRIAEGYVELQTLAHVWPPGLGEVAELPDDEPDTLAAPAPCTLKKRPAVILLYASPGKDETLRFLKGCPGEVIVGEKREAEPVGSMKSAAAHAAGGRTAFVVDRNGDKLRELLNRTNGVERTAAYFRKKLKSGYDYIVIDEITAHPQFADGTSTNRRLRKVLQRMPRNTIIPYISIDLTQYADGFTKMKNRRLLLRAFKRRARVIALEVYLKTPQVIAGGAPAAFRRAADRLALAVKGLPYGAGINRRAITVLGASVRGGSAQLVQYRYLTQPSRDLESIKRQVNAVRHGSRRLRSQKGLGYYFVFRTDLMPFSQTPYSYDALIRRMRLQAARFK